MTDTKIDTRMFYAETVQEQNLASRPVCASLDAMAILEKYGIAGPKAVALLAELQALDSKK